MNETRERKRSIRYMEDNLVGRLLSEEWSRARDEDCWVVGEYHVEVASVIGGGLYFIITGVKNDSTPIIKQGKAFRKLLRHFRRVVSAEIKLDAHNRSVQHKRDLQRLIYNEAD